MMNTRLGLSDLALIFKVTVELNMSNLSVCGGGTSVFSENNALFFVNL